MRAGLMRVTLLRAGLLVAGLLALFWAMGGFHWVEQAAAGAQKTVQAQLAGAVRAIRAGQGGALATLLALCFAYGFVHAAGPGHGKFLIGGYGVARRVGVWRLSGIAVLTAMAQAAVAVVMVHAGLWLLGWTREQMVGAAEGVMVIASYGAIAGIGLWLAWRGGRALWQGAADRGHLAHPHGHHHDHDHGDGCGCGHAHGPAPEAVERLAGWRDTLVLVAGVAVRPCSGALFLLILTWQLGIAGAGIAGAFAMGAGVASVTVLVAVMAVWAREGALSTLPVQGVARALPAVELAAGLAIAAIAVGLIARAG